MLGRRQEINLQLTELLDSARLALFLASDEARTITGQSVNVDAGLVMS